MKRLSLALAVACGFALTTFAQVGAPNTGINASLLRMFGDTKYFSAKGELRVADDTGKEISSMPVGWALLDGKLRAELDLSQMKGPSMPPQAMAMLKQTGMDKMDLIISGQNNTTLMIYPGAQAYAPISEKDTGAGESKVEVTDLGKETVDGHPCVKKKVTTTDAKGKPQEAFLWAATDLKDFPIKMEMKQKKNTVQIHFEKPSLEKPDAKLFEAPAGYTKYDNIQALMQASMMKMFSAPK
jgi:hypothetical protein